MEHLIPTENTTPLTACNRRSFLGKSISFLTLGTATLYGLPWLRAQSPTAPSTPPLAALINPVPIPEWLDKWQSAARQPVRSSLDPLINHLLYAAENEQKIAINYEGGSHFGETRRISPGLIFRCEGYSGTWVDAYCHTREAQRTFAIERIRLTR
ncbi:MAG: WYL domain-containing protein [Chthoniobacterales bacterium]